MLLYLPEVPWSIVNAVCRPNIDVACVVEHILLSLCLISHENDIIWSKRTLSVRWFAYSIQSFPWKTKLEELELCDIHTNGDQAAHTFLFPIMEKFPLTLTFNLLL